MNARPTSIRFARVAERDALECLQRRSSMHEPMYRAQLAAHPDAIELPAEQIAAGLVRVAEQARVLVGFSVLLQGCEDACELDGLFVEPDRMRAGIGRRLVEGREVEDVARDTGFLEVKTFHQLCEDLGREAGVLPERPVPIPQDWWDKTLPRALDEAIGKLDPRYHAIVVDEGQDFADGWLLSLEGLLYDGRDDVMYVFHDPAQAIYRDDSVAGLGMTEYPLDLNCRNAQPIHDVVRRFAGEGSRLARCGKTAVPRSSSRRRVARRRSVPCAASCIGSASTRASSPGTSRC